MIRRTTALDHPSEGPADPFRPDQESQARAAVNAAGGRAERPSKTARKAMAHDLQALGRRLSELSADQLAGIAMDERLREALAELRRTRTHEGKRRQMQLVGKLMRGVDADPLREAVAALQLGPAREALLLHQAEYWREAMVASDESITRFVAEHPEVDVQPLRQLVRQCRVEQTSAPSVSDGASRHGPSWRALFKLIRPIVQSRTAAA